MTIAEYIQVASPVKRKGDGDLLYNCPECGGKETLEVEVTGRRRWYCHKCTKTGKVEGDLKSLRASRAKVVYHPTDFYKASRRSLSYRYLRYHRDMPVEVVRLLDPHEGPCPFSTYLPCYPIAGSRNPFCFVERSVIDGVKSKYFNRLVRNVRRASGLFWGLNHLRRPVGQLVICEGSLDAAWTMAHPGTEAQVLATLGKRLTRDQTQTIVGLRPDSVTFAYDGSAKRACTRAACELARHSGGVKIWAAMLPGDSDPADLKGDVWGDLRRIQ